MNKMVRAVEEFIDETEMVNEEWSDATKELVNAGVNIDTARDVAYGLIFSKLMRVLSRKVLLKSVGGNCCGRCVRSRDE